jgi:hypothetical protein
VRPFDELIAEAEQADVTGWGFGWLDGRATEERPPWGFVPFLSQHLAQHVGPGSAFELIEAFLGPQPEARQTPDRPVSRRAPGRSGRR